MERLPFLVIIPHAGLDVPEELYGYENVSPLNIFFDSDAGAETIFSMGELMLGTVSSPVSKLFVDVDREYKDLYPATSDGVVKSVTSMNRSVFREGCYPDEIAVSNILKRYYFPFHDTVRNSLKEKKFSAIIECHTHMPVGPSGSHDRGMPRPLIITGYRADGKSATKQTAPEEMAVELASTVSKNLSREGETVTEISKVYEHGCGDYIMRNYSLSQLPVLYLSISRSLFLNERYFDLERIRIDPQRLKKIRNLTLTSLEKFYSRCF